MDQEEKQLLEENLKLSKENKVLLLKIRSVQRWSQISRIFYWFIIIAVSFGAFYYLQPYLGSLLNVYTGGVSGVNNISDMTKNLKNNQGGVQDLLNSLNN